MLIAPFLLFIAVAIKVTSRGPVVVKLERVSKGSVVNIYKFRTMIDGAHGMKASLAHLNERTDRFSRSGTIHVSREWENSCGCFVSTNFPSW